MEEKGSRNLASDLIVWENDMAKLFAKVSFPVYVTSQEDTIVWFNTSFLTLTGYRKEEIIGKPFVMLFTSPQGNISFRTFDSIPSRRIQCFHKNGFPIDVEISTSGPENNHFRRTIWFLKDVTRETKLTGELVFRENMFHTIFNNSFNAGLITSLDGKILETNAQVSDMFNYSKKELKNMNRRDLMLNEHNLEAYFSDLSNNDKTPIVITCKRNNGELFKAGILSQTYYNHTGEFFIYTQIEDLSHSQKLESIIQETNATSLTGYFEFNCLTGEHAFTEILKQIIEVPSDYSPDIKRDILCIKGAENRFKMRRMIAACINDGKSREDNIQIYTARGNEKWIRIVINPEKVKGFCTRLFGTFQDITETRMLHTTIQKTTNELNTILESIADIVLVLNEKGYIVNANKSVKSIWGYCPEQLLSLKKTDLVVKDDIYITEENFEKAREGSYTASFENRCLSKNGILHCMSWSIKWDTNEKQYYLVGRDITQRIREEKEKKFLSLLYANDATGAVRTDRNGNIIWINSAFENMTGYTLDEISKEIAPFHFLFGIKTGKETVKKLKDNAKKQISSTEEIIIYHKNRSYQWVQLLMSPIHDALGQLEGWLVTFKDISLKKSEEYRMKLLQTVMDNAYDSIMITEGLSKECGERYRIIYVNDLFEKCTGYTKEEVLGNTPSFLQGDETDKSTRKMIRDKLEQWEPFNAELINYKKNGQKFWNQIFFIPVVNEKGGYKTWISIQRDITRQKSMEALKKAQEAEIKKQITKALLRGEDNHRKLMSMELHDNVGQLLTGMKMFLSQFKKNRKEKYLDESLLALDESIKEIRDLSHSMSIPDSFENAFVEHIQHTINKINSTGTIKFRLNASINESSLNMELLINVFRIIQEQVNNIIKYSKAENAVITLMQDGHHLLVSIKDDGVGFDKNEQSMGIGLTNIRTRVNLFNGNLKINTKPGMGCEIQMTLEIE